MPVIDLTRYIVASAGTWTDPSQDENLFGFTTADTMSPGRLLLRWAGDFVALTGPLRVRVTVQAENMTVPLALIGNLRPEPSAVFEPATAGAATIRAGITISEAAIGHIAAGVYTPRGRALGLQASTIYSYTLDIAAGQAWPFSLSEQLAALRLQNLRTSRFEQLGNNLGFRVIIEPAFVVPECVPAVTSSDLPCDFAAVDQGNTARFFPVACEPCEGSVIGLPPTGSVALVIPPAEGGCVRTRFFNGMFITREDLETEQRYNRLKSKLHNRASGAGVVWGLAVGKQATYLCVLPGYGVDCCGNDLALTTTYKVDIAALVADPAAASLVHQAGAHRMHLLLEYVECPSDPRPVHGDPCAPDVSRCEMSRIRESVRLRLVPPRDCATTDSAPIQKFLDEVRELRKRFPLEQAPAGPTFNRAPFQLRFTADNTVVMATPTVGRTSINLPATALRTLTIEVVPEAFWTFVHGTISAQALAPDNTSIPGIVKPEAPIDLSLRGGFGAVTPKVTFTLQPATPATTTGPAPTAGPALNAAATAPPSVDAPRVFPSQLVFKLTGWQFQTILAGEDDPAPSGDLTFNLTISPNGPQENSLVQSAVAINRLDIGAPPCSGEPCTPRTRGGTAATDCVPANVAGMTHVTGPYGAASYVSADPTPVLPWLHPDPANPSSAADPKVLMLAALGGWLEEMIAREGEGTVGGITSTRREIAQGIYRAAWVMLFGVNQQADPAAVGGSLHRLLEGWCSELLWKGPRCCGDPHGVVIGCAIVEGGTIQSIDPFGGRRYVVHYPLLEHWGGQFGLAPLDVSASRFFSKLCCLASLPAPGVNQPDVPAALLHIGGGYLLAGDPKAMGAKLTDARINIVEHRRVGTPEMIVSALTLIGTKPGKTTTQPRPFSALVLADFVADQTVMLLMPA